MSNKQSRLTHAPRYRTVLEKEWDAESMRRQGRVVIAFGSIWLALTLLMCGLIGWSEWVNAQLSRQGRIAQGKVRGTSMEFSHEGTSYEMRYEFLLPSGQKIEDSLTVSPRELPKDWQIGYDSRQLNIPVEVEYLPQNPAYHRLRGHAYNKVQGSAFGGVITLVVFIGIGVGIIRLGAKIMRGEHSIGHE